MMQIYDENENRLLTEEELEDLKKEPEFRQMICEQIEGMNYTITKLTIDRNRSDKIIGLAIGTEIGSFLNMFTDTIGITEDNPQFSSIRWGIIIASIILRNTQMIRNSIRSTKIRLLTKFKEELEKENPWLEEEKPFVKTKK